jgi:hypothetical protein
MLLNIRSDVHCSTRELDNPNKPFKQQSGQLIGCLHSNETFTDNNNTVEYLFKARTVKPAETAVAREQLCKQARY